MKNSLLILAGAAALSLASCSQEKTTEVTTAPGAADGMTTTTTTTTTTAPMSAADMEARAQLLADKMVANMKITDAATKTKIRTVYVNRYRKMDEMRTQYAADTTGMAVAMRDANVAADAEFKTVFVDPTQYQTYEANRVSYYEMAYVDAAPAPAADMNSASSSSMDAGAADGGKMKVQADGDIKIKDAAGNKTKVDGDDGTVKLKPKDGDKTILK